MSYIPMDDVRYVSRNGPTKPLLIKAESHNCTVPEDLVAFFGGGGGETGAETITRQPGSLGSIWMLDISPLYQPDSISSWSIRWHILA